MESSNCPLFEIYMRKEYSTVQIPHRDNVPSEIYGLILKWLNYSFPGEIPRKKDSHDAAPLCTLHMLPEDIKLLILGEVFNFPIDACSSSTQPTTAI
jgi:hypothetical protein